MTYLLEYDVGADRLFWRPISEESAERLRLLNARTFDAMGLPYKMAETPWCRPKEDGTPYWPVTEDGVPPWRKQAA